IRCKRRQACSSGSSLIERLPNDRSHRGRKPVHRSLDTLLHIGVHPAFLTPGSCPLHSEWIHLHHDVVGSVRECKSLLSL
ncbi:hypothetical protein PMAYCL1PPCAC_13693, partial [Pristionchus mayeri]